ncbi:hypothetical protein MMC25_002404 [Agyrium rufum]|nr:hypothetical protein [Agyrium rufum]
MNTKEINAPTCASPISFTRNYPYGTSISLSASSSTSSIFSAADDRSSQSSGSASPSSLKTTSNATWETVFVSSSPSDLAQKPVQCVPTLVAPIPEARTECDYTINGDCAVAPELRQHPRRTRQDSSCEGATSVLGPRPPPSLTRQSERKDNFVENLVGKQLPFAQVGDRAINAFADEDTTTQMIEVIWPLSVMPCNRDAVLGGKNLIGLRTFIQEVLKRSKTSYSTLQVALYYLILVKSCIPKCDFTAEQSEDSYANRAMQCGRRMFLTALILASKYLQDRNYSARAWSRISGLKICEINSNESAFLRAVGWKLHVPESIFQRWTDIVLKYSSSQSGSQSDGDLSPWKRIIPNLTPALDDLSMSFDARVCFQEKPFGNAKLASKPVEVHTSRHLLLPSSLGSVLPTPKSRFSHHEATPTAPQPAPRLFESTPAGEMSTCRQLPPLNPFGRPTPTFTQTPRSSNFGTPAVSTSGFCPLSAQRSMCFAMQSAQNNTLARASIDQWRNATQQEPLMPPTRRSSLARSSSIISSPESMISDGSSRSSRSSSVSSIASSTGALPQPQPSLAMQATCRRANMQMGGCFKDREMAIRTVIQGSSPPVSIRTDQVWDTYTSSPEEYFNSGSTSYTHKVSSVRLQHPQPIQAVSVPRIKTPDLSDREAAESLRDLALCRTNTGTAFPVRYPTSPSTASAGCKRERPNSMDFSSVQQTVRSLLAEQSTDPNSGLLSAREDDGTVLPDSRVADSFLLRPSGFRLPSLDDALSYSTSRGSRAEPGRGASKRLCHDGTRDSAGLCAPMGGPGMWGGII